MAKLALKLRDQKRRKTVEKFKARRAQLLEIIYDSRASDEAKDEARDKLQKLPRDASPVRQRNRCAMTGRSRGVYQKFGLGRNKLREATMKGDVPGLRKASWELLYLPARPARGGPQPTNSFRRIPLRISVLEKEHP